MGIEEVWAVIPLLASNLEGMQLSARFLNDVASVNSFEYANAIEFSVGDTQSVYLQLIDASLDKAEQGFVPVGRRYCPAATSTLEVTLVNVDDAKTLVRFATQPFAQDPSIWRFTCLPSDPIAGTVNLKLKLAEPTRTLNSGVVPGLLLRVR